MHESRFLAWAWAWPQVPIYDSIHVVRLFAFKPKVLVVSTRFYVYAPWLCCVLGSHTPSLSTIFHFCVCSMSEEVASYWCWMRRSPDIYQILLNTAIITQDKQTVAFFEITHHSCYIFFLWICRRRCSHSCFCHRKSLGINFLGFFHGSAVIQGAFSCVLFGSMRFGFLNSQHSLFGQYPDLYRFLNKLEFASYATSN